MYTQPAKIIVCALVFLGWLLCSPAGAGRFYIDGGRLRFSPMVSTRMTFSDGMDVERQLLYI
jgi:hypothetical protein